MWRRSGCKGARSRWEVRSYAIRIVGCVDGYKGAARKGRKRPSEQNNMLHRLVSAFASDAVGGHSALTLRYFQDGGG